MLDAWINRDDVLKLLDKSECVNNLLEKRGFIITLNNLKEHKKPKQTRNKNRANNLNYIIPLINQYKLNHRKRKIPLNELSKIIKVSDRTIRRWVQNGNINRYGYHKHHFYDLSEIERFIS